MAYKKFCADLHQIGVTEDIIQQKENEILAALRSHGMLTGNHFGGIEIEDQGQLTTSGSSHTGGASLHTPSY